MKRIVSTTTVGILYVLKAVVFENGPFPASFSLFSSFLYSLQQTNVLYKKLPMTGFEPRASGSEATALPTEPLTTTAQSSDKSFSAKGIFRAAASF